MWARIINMLLGLWLMAAPDILGYDRPAADNDRIVGPILATFACVAIWEITRSLRWVNLLLGLWLILAPWVLGFPTDATINSTAVGAVVTALPFVRGRMTHRFGGGWTSLWRPSESTTG